VAVHASDCAVALMALDARVHLVGPGGERQIPLSELYLDPGSTPWRETTLAERELIVAIACPVPAPHSAYVKVRDRASFEFALVSAAAVVRSSAGGRSQIALALGGVAPRPWRLTGAEAMLAGRPLTRTAIEKAVHASLSSARALPGNAFKIPLARHAAVRAAAMAGGLA
jgi:xanthine dehydrogenase YagS FAD-binding subunit